MGIDSSSQKQESIVNFLNLTSISQSAKLIVEKRIFQTTVTKNKRKLRKAFDKKQDKVEKNCTRTGFKGLWHITKVL